jgi:hypothetical protein
MITKRVSYLVALLLLLPLMACAQADKVDLKLVLTQGQSFTIALGTSNAASATIDGKPISTVESLKVSLLFTVQSVSAEGNYTLRAAFQNPSYSVSGTAPGIDLMSQILSNAFAAVNGQSFKVELSRAGVVTSVSGLDPAVRAATAALASYPEAVRHIIEAFIARGLSDANWRQGLADVFSILPERPVAVDERWSRKLSPGGAGTDMQGDAYFRITERGNGVSKLKAYYDIKSLGMSLPTGVSYSLSGTEEGTLSVDEVTGLVTHARLKSSLAGKASAAETNGKPVPLTMSSTVTIDRN